MKRFKKVIALLLAAVLMTSLTACGNGQDDGSDKKKPTKQAEEKSGTEELTKTSSGEAPDPEKVAKGFEDADDFRNGLRKFSASLLEQCYEGDTIMVSALSVYAALGMLANGAEGETLKEMENMFGCSAETLANAILYLNQSSKDRNVMQMANSIWLNSNVKFNVKDAFLGKIGTYYQSAVMKAPFSNAKTVEDINEWVKKNTKNRIEKVIDALTDEQVMILINCLTFDGEWIVPFDEDATQKDTVFHRANGTEKKVDMMHGEGDRYFEDEDMIGFVKGYKQGYAFRAYLPKEGKTVKDIVAKLKSAPEMPYQDASEIYVRIPKFEERSGKTLNQALQNLGMKKAFTSDAEFGNVADIGINISTVLQKTYIKMSESGTEAAAVTVVTLETSCYNPERIVRTVTLDRPFVYEIIDEKTGVTLFIGIYE
ncbi:MAG: serpin family protein [Lachnospiraceae bacterium]|nr:serpin family protein [Lachnospiraceae bacterium]